VHRRDAARVALVRVMGMNSEAHRWVVFPLFWYGEWQTCCCFSFFVIYDENLTENKQRV
jgi:hypothetical protein